jgi:heptosyltransferase-2/heptosyltransferase-3
MNPSRILFIAEGQLGDLLVLTPAIAATKKAFPQSSISVLIFQRRTYFRNADETSYFIDDPKNGAAEVFLSNPHVDKIMEVDQHVLSQLGWLSRVKAEIDIMLRLRKKGFDTVMVFPRDRFVVWAYASGARTRVGQLRQVYPWLLTHKPDIHKRDAGVVRYYCTLVESIGVKVDSYDTEFVVPKDAAKRAPALLQSKGVADGESILVIHPGTHGSDRVWPPERYAQLIDTIQSEGAAKVLLCGGAYDKVVVNKIRSLSKTGPVVADTGNDISLLASVFSRGTLFIGSNSGPRHLAAAVGTRTLALLPLNDQFEWEVYEDKSRHRILQGHDSCPTCPHGTCLCRIPNEETYGSHCMRMISVESVIAQAREMLRGATR